MKHLTLKQRYEISALFARNISQKEIARQVGVSESTISNEKKRNKNTDGLYDADTANNLAARRRKNKKPYKFNEKIKKSIENLLEQQYSPEQIVGVLKKENTLTMSHEWIYQHIYEDKKNGGKLYENLRQKRKYRKKRLLIKDKRGVIPNKVMIADRPPEVETRERYGDWEGDTIIGANHQGAILTLVERKSRFTYIEKLDGKSAKCVENAVINFFKRTGMPCETITFDNGKEFTNHQEITKEIGVKIYFANPYHSWERGTNENMNGLIRQYIPKKSDFNNYSVENIIEIQDKLNNRPRKILEYDSPIQNLTKNKIA
ncbi:MAG: IS30 family transposase, partial [Bacteroidia bacterium]